MTMGPALVRECLSEVEASFRVSWTSELSKSDTGHRLKPDARHPAVRFHQCVRLGKFDVDREITRLGSQRIRVDSPARRVKSQE